MQTWKTYQDKNQERFLDELMALLRIPSMSSDSTHQTDMLTCAEAVRKSLLDAGADQGRNISDSRPSGGVCGKNSGCFETNHPGLWSL